MSKQSKAVAILKSQRQRNMPETLAITTEEGGVWHTFTPWRLDRPLPPWKTVHSIKFADGSVWDCINGWRKQHGRN